MNYANIKRYDIADGIGVRTTLFVSGCTNHCKNCFQPQTWDFTFGKEFTKETEQYLIDETRPEYVNGITLLGGEPFEIENQRGVINFLRHFKRELPDKTIWAYTGFVYDKDLVEDGKRHCEVTDELLSMIDVLVDGPFIEEKKDITLLFRGSANQRLIDVQKTLKNKEVILWEK